MGEAVTQVEASFQELAAREGKYLTFVLGKEEYGLEILKVKEIIGMMDITSVPNVPSYVKGVINLRGKVIPVVELRLKFGMESIPYTERTCIIVVDVQVKGCLALVGIVVDAVSEVLNINREEIENTPNFGTEMDTNYILGMAKVKGQVKILLDIDQVLDNSEMAL
ncbi:MAG TPA: purine-binding chemotaxis protein CheW [Proteobacteria bacterium]|nr:purine-binding chemotaxis protein CheW [Pseudomonadota bacterium]